MVIQFKRFFEQKNQAHAEIPQYKFHFTKRSFAADTFTLNSFYLNHSFVFKSFQNINSEEINLIHFSSNKHKSLLFTLQCIEF